MISESDMAILEIASFFIIVKTSLNKSSDASLGILPAITSERVTTCPVPGGLSVAKLYGMDMA